MKNGVLKAEGDGVPDDAVGDVTRSCFGAFTDLLKLIIGAIGLVVGSFHLVRF